MNQKLPIFSNTIDALRVFAMVGVVLIHSRYTTATHDLGSEIMDFVSGKLCSIPVPCFYFISGMLFFKGLEGNIGRKLRSRIFTLLVPYICWNVIGALCFIIKLKFFGSSFPQYSGIELTPLALLKGFWSYSWMGLDDVTYPYDFALWFLRNLIVITPIAALIYKGCKVSVWLLPILLLAYVSSDFINDEYCLISSLCYFYGGGIIQQYFEIGSNTVDDHKSLKYMSIIGIALFIGWCLAADKLPDKIVLICTYPLYVFCIFCLILFFNIICGHGDIKGSIYVKSLFFIYAAHGLWVSVARSINLHIFQPDGSVGYLVVYIANFIVLWYVDLLLYMFMHKFMPGITNILTGNRSGNR